MPKLKIRNKATGEIKEIEASEAQNFGLDPKVALERFKAQSELEKAAGGEDISLSAEEKKRSQGQKDIYSVINEAKRLYNQPLSTGERPDPNNQQDLSAAQAPGFGGKIQGFSLGIKAALNQAPNAKTYNKIKEGFLASLKEATGDTGVLSDTDIKRLGALLPGFSETDETAISNWESIDRVLQSKFGNVEGFSYIPKEGQQVLSQQTLSPTQQPSQTQIPQQSQNPLMAFLQRGMTGASSNKNLEPNFLADLLLPRAAQVARQQKAGQEPSLDERVGVVGEAANRLVSPFFGPLGFAAGGAVEGLTKPGADVGERVKSGTVQGGGQLATGGLLKVLGIGASKLGWGANKARNEAAQVLEKAGIKIGTDKTTINVAKQMVKDDISGPKYQPLIEKLAKGEGLGGNEGLKLLIRTGKKTFTGQGEKRLADQSEYYDLLRSALRGEFSKKAPEIIKRTSDLARGYKTAGVAKKTAIYGGLAATGLGGLGVLWNILSGKGLPGGRSQ